MHVVEFISANWLERAAAQGVAEAESDLAALIAVAEPGLEPVEP